MNTEVTKEAPTVEEAVDAALEELGVQQDAVEYEVLQEPGKRVFGLGSDKAAKVRVWIKSDAAKEIARAHAEVLGGDDEEGDDDSEAPSPPSALTSEPQEDLSDEEPTRQMGFRHPVVVDIEGYRHRRRQKIEDIARRAAEKAARQRMPVRLRPMTPYERRIVHVALREDGRVVTASEGTEPYRQVVIKPR